MKTERSDIKKRFTVFLIVFSILLTLSGGALAAQDAAEAGVVFEASDADSGGLFTMTMTMYNATFNVFSFVLRYDPETVEPVSPQGTVTTEFLEFAEVPAGLDWLSFLGASIDKDTGLIEFTGYVEPGNSPATDGLPPSEGNAVVGSGGLTMVTFTFHKTGSGAVNIELATASDTKPYVTPLPNGGALYDIGYTLPANYSVILPASLGESSTVIETGPVDELTANELLADCIILKIGSYAVVADSGLTAFYQGEKSVVPYIDENDRTFVPLRFIAERLGAAVDWEQSTKTATITNGNTVIKMSVGDKFYTKNGVEKAMDTAAVQVESSPGYVRTLVPIRFVAEALGKTVGWDDANRLVIITPGDYDWDGGGELEDEVISKALTLYTLYGSLI
ncbi:MAG: copper amine oxidase N-terminal domain-containing protein [Oscillospiraceae bacterium]